MNQEEWKPLKGYETIYEVSSFGNVRSLTRIIRHHGDSKSRREGRLIKPHVNKWGYPCFLATKNLVRKLITVHRAVALTFHPNPENKSEVNHKNGIKHDNRSDNLEWMTHQENVIHSYKILGKKNSLGEANGRSVLKDKDVKEIRAWWKTGDVTIADLCRVWGVTRTVISFCVKNKTWRHVA